MSGRYAADWVIQHDIDLGCTNKWTDGLKKKKQQFWSITTLRCCGVSWARLDNQEIPQILIVHFLSASPGNDAVAREVTLKY